MWSAAFEQKKATSVGVAAIWLITGQIWTRFGLISDLESFITVK
jgi:hypothetical protein